MILLEKKSYYKVIPLLGEVTINKLFAKFVVENKVDGSVYVDNVGNPKSCYVIHSYGMSLLFGESGDEDFNNGFKYYVLNELAQTDKVEWMQAYPESWDSVLKNLFGEELVLASENKSGKVELNSRVNFKFNLEKYLDKKSPTGSRDQNIQKTSRSHFSSMKGSVIPYYFWNSAEDFLENGIGFSALHNGELASIAYSAFIDGNKLEIGIETVEEFRGNGYAKITCEALIDYCLINDFEPVWACRLENAGSYNLAMKLGFEEVNRIPYYKLNN